MNLKDMTKVKASQLEAFYIVHKVVDLTGDLPIMGKSKGDIDKVQMRIWLMENYQSIISKGH